MASPAGPQSRPRSGAGRTLRASRCLIQPTNQTSPSFLSPDNRLSYDCLSRSALTITLYPTFTVHQRLRHSVSILTLARLTLGTEVNRWRKPQAHACAKSRCHHFRNHPHLTPSFNFRNSTVADPLVIAPPPGSSYKYRFICHPQPC